MLAAVSLNATTASSVAVSRLVKHRRGTAASARLLHASTSSSSSSSSRKRHARSVVAPVAYTQWLLDKPGCVAARCDDMDLIPHSKQAELGVCPPKPIDLTHLVG